MYRFFTYWISHEDVALSFSGVTAFNEAGFSAASAPTRRNSPASLAPFVLRRMENLKKRDALRKWRIQSQKAALIWPGGSGAPMLRIPVSEVASVRRRALKLTIKRRDTVRLVGSDAFMGIYKPLRRGCSGTNLWRVRRAAYFVAHFEQLSHSLAWFLFTLILQGHFRGICPFLTKERQGTGRCLCHHRTVLRLGICYIICCFFRLTPPSD